MRSAGCVGFVCSVLSIWVSAVRAVEPHAVQSIARQIDQLVSRRLAAEGLPPSPLSSDSVFVRRAFLTLTGRIPTVQDTVGFLDDAAADKRLKLIDRLLASPSYGEHFANHWHRLLTGREFGMARPPDTRLLATWLAEEFNANRPWNELATRILLAEGTHGKQPATIFFTLHGNSRGIPEPNVIATTAGKLFLGLDLECAECHDHPFRNWSQQEFWSLAAFFSRVQDSGNKGGTKRWIKETPLEPGQAPALAIPESSFTNVGMKVAARLPDPVKTELDGRSSLRSVYAAWMTSDENPFFARNLANRIWAHCFGRGLMNPLDGFRRDPNRTVTAQDDQSRRAQVTHPELLQLLATEFVAAGFDQKHLLRCICSSKTWQRGSEPLAQNQHDLELYSHRTPTVMTAEVLLDSLTVAWGDALLSDQRPKMDFRNPLLPLYSPREEFLHLFRTLPKDADQTKYTQGIPQLLFLMNSPELNSEPPLVDQLVRVQTDVASAVEQLYLAALARRPSREELSDALDFIQGQQTPRDGLVGVFWTLFNRSEFMINH